MVTDIKLPANAALLVPHRPPLLLVDRLLEFTGKAGVVESVIAPDNLFLTDEGTLKEIAMVELLAQSAAAVKGYSDLMEGKKIKKGYLVEIKEFVFKDGCRKGDAVNIFIGIEKSFSGFSVINGHLACRGKEIAAGTLKLWAPDEG